MLLATRAITWLPIAARRIAVDAQAGTRRVTILVNIFNAGIKLDGVFGVFIELVMVDAGRGFLIRIIIAFGHPIIITQIIALKIDAGAV